MKTKRLCIAIFTLTLPAVAVAHEAIEQQQTVMMRGEKRGQYDVN